MFNELWNVLFSEAYFFVTRTTIKKGKKTMKCNLFVEINCLCIQNNLNCYYSPFMFILCESAQMQRVIGGGNHDLRTLTPFLNVMIIFFITRTI